MRRISIVIAVALLLIVVPLGMGGPGNAQETLPTPRGQLGGPAPLQLTPDPLQPTNPTPPPPTATATAAAPSPTPSLTPTAEAQSVATPDDAAPSDDVMTTAEVIASIRPAVVTVIADAVRETEGSGSGFIIDEDGHIVTSQRVVENAGNLAVVLDSGDQRPATLVGEDPLTGLALLRMEGAVPATVSFAATDRPAPGDAVLAFGTAYGTLPGTVTRGIVSVPDRRLPAGPAATTLIQHDASTPRGMDGGPLVTTRGDVIGLTVAVAVDGNGFAVPSLPDVDLPDLPGVDVDLPDLPGRVGSGAAISFAIPADTVTRVTSSIRSDGRVAYPYLGVSAAAVTAEIAVVQGLDEPAGVVIEDVVDDSPASVAGLETDDVIVAIDGEPFRRGELLADVLYQYQPGNAIEVTVLRDGDEVTLSVDLAERPID